MIFRNSPAASAGLFAAAWAAAPCLDRDLAFESRIARAMDLAHPTGPTVETILRNRPAAQQISAETMEQAQRDFRRLSIETAQRTVRFWQLHNRIEKVN